MLARIRVRSASTAPGRLVALAFDSLRKDAPSEIVSKMSELCASEKAPIAQLARDERFLKLCRQLGGARSLEDPQTLVERLDARRMTRMMSTLAARRKRTTPLLQSLAAGLCRQKEKLDLKQCSDLLFAAATLNFPERTLLERACSDAIVALQQPDDGRCRSAAVGSLATSLGILKYGHETLLVALGEWLAANERSRRSRDAAAFVIAAASLGASPDVCPPNVTNMGVTDFTEPESFLDYMWSLLTLDRLAPHDERLREVLEPEFAKILYRDDIKGFPFASHKRLCNLNGYAVLMNYGGPTLSQEVIDSLTLTYSKEKLQFVSLLHQTLKSLLSSDDYIEKGCDSKMGFLFDAHMVLDNKCTPHPINFKAVKGEKLFKIAIFGLDYHDFCRYSSRPLGSINLYKRLLELQGFKVMLVPYSELNSQDKLVHRVKLLEKKMKEIVSC